MDFEFSKDQQMLKKSAREFMEKECPRDRTRELMADGKGFDAKMWKKMVQLGFTGLAVDDQYGGSGGDFVELALFMEEMGRTIVPSPFFETVCLCAAAVAEFGTDRQKETILPKIAEKGEIWSLAVNETVADCLPQDIRLKATAEGERFILNGEKLFVPYAGAAKELIVAARTRNGQAPEDGVTLFMVDTKTSGITIEAIPTAAPGKKCAVNFRDVQVSGEDILGEIHNGWTAMEFMICIGAVLKAAEMSGGARAALDLAVKYAKERVQFGRPIAANQVVQHKLVKMLTQADGLRNMVYEAAWNIAVNRPCRILSSAAKVKANTAYHRVCYDAVVIHGAIGWTSEMDVSLYLLRAKDLENACGSTAFHKERIARELESQAFDFLA